MPFRSDHRKYFQDFNKHKLLKYLLIALFSSFLLVFIFDLAFPFRPAIEYSQVIEDKDGNVLHAFLTSDDKWRLKTNLDEITPELRKTILFKEDKFFPYHFGVNPIAVSRALVNNLRKGEITSGASTITMQVARMLKPKERTYLNKFKEMFRAIQLELHYSKDEILQMYLNLVPYGSNIEGVKSASLLYFDQYPQSLSIAQIVSLSIIPNDPNAFRPGQNDSYILEVRNRWLKYFQKKKLFSFELLVDALNEPVNAYRHEAPKYAPHFSYFLNQKYPDKDFIKTFIDLELQLKTEQLCYNYIQRLKYMNITNASILILDNDKNEVITYAGSADFWDSQHQGMVDGVQAIRSPGSTLKPFLYALAIDRGLITPKFVLTDVPINYGGYRPENYDEKYHGLITVEDALALSLNIPAVKILDQLGEKYFIRQLSKAGFGRIQKDRDELGLSVILGGCGVRLEELTRLFSCFGNKGILKPIRYTVFDTNTTNDTLISPAASFMITDILTMLTRPDLPKRFENVLNLPKVAWKTGTSYGRRDAWAIGYNTRYTVGVWVGNFPGIGVPELNGSDYAVPLLFKVFNALGGQNQGDWFIQPGGMDYRLVCSESGLPPSEFCHDLVKDAYIPGISSSTNCRHMKWVYVNKDESKSFCRTCKPKLGYKKKRYRNYPSEIIAFYEEEGIPYDNIPTHNPDCERIYYDNAPRITSLTNGMEYLLFAGEGQQLMLRAQVEHGVSKIHWYIEDKFYKSCPADEKLFFKPSPGEQKISCADDKGRNTDIWITVKFL